MWDPMSLSADMEFRGFVLGLLLEWKKFVGPIKVEVSTQIQNRGPDLGAPAGVALSPHPLEGRTLPGKMPTPSSSVIHRSSSRMSC
jgi:hypothetical protein